MNEEIKQYIMNNVDKSALLAFSGGVDSTLLLCILSKIKTIKTTAVTFSTSLHPMHEVDECISLCKKYGIEHKIIHIDELKDQNVIKNTIDRCYFCKKNLFSKLEELRLNLGYDKIIDGTNFSDTKVYRPGIKALSEYGVLSPLKDLKITKDKVRDIALSLKISVSKKPSAPCMATRLPYNNPLDISVLNKLDRGENILKSMGFYNVRLRLHDNIIRIEIDKKDFIKFIDIKDTIIDQLKKEGFDYITLDLEGFRSGSMDIHINK